MLDCARAIRDAPLLKTNISRVKPRHRLALADDGAGVPHATIPGYIQALTLVEDGRCDWALSSSICAAQRHDGRDPEGWYQGRDRSRAGARRQGRRGDTRRVPIKFHEVLAYDLEVIIINTEIQSGFPAIPTSFLVPHLHSNTSVRLRALSTLNFWNFPRQPRS